jgi:HicB family
MATSYVEGLLDDLESLAAIAPEEGEVATAARRLGRALAASAATRMLEVMTRAALDLSSRLSSGHVEVRIVGEDPELVFVEDEPPAPKPPAEDPTTARITLRLPQRLKEEIEAAAERDGVSVNTWLIRSLERSTATTRHHQAGNRLRGFARA